MKAPVTAPVNSNAMHVGAVAGDEFMFGVGHQQRLAIETFKTVAKHTRTTEL